MSVVLLAYHEMGAMALDVLQRRGVRVSMVFTHRDDPDEGCWFRSVADLAGSLGIPVERDAPIGSDDAVARITACAPDVILSVYYRAIVGARVRSIPRHGSFNLHGSLLPKYRGRAPLNWQLVHGERVSGVTLHRMTGRVDAGEVVDQESVAVGPDETAPELHRKLVAAGDKVLARRIDALLDGTATGVPQDDSQATVFGRRTPADGRIDWTRPARRIHDLVRAVTAPWPGAFCETPGGRVNVWRTRVHDEGARWPEPGTVVRREGAPFVATGDGLLELVAYDAPTGLDLSPGVRLGEATPRDASRSPSAGGSA